MLKQVVRIVTTSLIIYLSDLLRRRMLCPMQLVYENVISISEEINYFYATQIDRLMVFMETIYVYCANALRSQIDCMGRMQSSSKLKQVVLILTTGL
jgi:hypothetical protein